MARATDARPRRARPIPSLSTALSFVPARATRAARLIRGLKYLCFSTAALISFPFPSVLLSEAFDQPGWQWLAYAWSTMFLLGSVLSLIGIAKKSWVGEYVGLWGVIIPLCLYAASCFLVGQTGQRVFLGFLTLGFAMSSVARFRDIVHQKHSAEYDLRVRSGRRGL